MEEGKELNISNLKIGDTIVYRGFPNCNLEEYTKDKTYTIIDFYNENERGVIVKNDKGNKQQINRFNLTKFFIPFFIQEKSNPILCKSEDKVNHPSHYTWLKEKCGIEVIDITRHLDFDSGNAVKYILRAGHKSEEGYSNKEKQIEDFKKAIFYLNDKIKMLEEEL